MRRLAEIINVNCNQHHVVLFVCLFVCLFAVVVSSTTANFKKTPGEKTRNQFVLTLTKNHIIGKISDGTRTVHIQYR